MRRFWFSRGPTAACGVLLFVWFFAESLLAAEQPGKSWRHTLGRDHPLVGRVWAVRDGDWVEQEELARRLQKSTYVLLGEKHDNADHHRLQALLIRSLSALGRRPAVAFEMLDVDEQSIIDRKLENAASDLPGLRAALRWDEKGWPEWELYEPVFRAALTNGLSIVAANLARTKTRELAVQGMSAVNPELVREFGLEQPLSPELHRRLAQELEASHCGHLSAAMTEKMMRVQRIRDAQMARQLSRSDGDGAVLIAGAFHVRNDYGVPMYLEKLGLTNEAVSLAFLEVHDDAIDPAAYAEAFEMERLPFDYVWFTPRVDDEDPCEKFAEQLKQMRQP